MRKSLISLDLGRSMDAASSLALGLLSTDQKKQHAISAEFDNEIPFSELGRLRTK